MDPKDVPVQVGTIRYLAPEILDNTLDVKNFIHLKQTDIYAFSLVLWEIIRRIRVGIRFF